MSYSYGEAATVWHNRMTFFQKEGIPTDRLIAFFTDHKELITDLPAYPFSANQLKGSPHLTTDAIVSRIPQAGIFLGFADCVPFVVYDSRQHLLAFAHIGWRSMALGLTGKLLHHLIHNHTVQPQDLFVVIGPSIKQSSYRFSDPIQSQSPAWQPFLVPFPNGDFGIDLLGFCLSEIRAAGISDSQVYAAPKDTATDPDLFSHYAATVRRQNHKQGRFFFYAFLKAPKA